MSKAWGLQEIEEEVMEMVREQLMELEPGEELEVTENLFEAGLDSMALMQLLLLIQERFEVTIPGAELSRKNFSTVRSIALIIQKQAP